VSDTLAGAVRGGGAGTEVAMDDPKQPTSKASPRSRNARELRKKATDAERLMWTALRDKRLDGFSFRRQVPIGAFTADFACHSVRLVIEIERDGSQHSSGDAARTAAIEARGFRVVRFSNAEVMSNRDGVLQSIAAELAASAPAPTLPRKRDRRRAAAAGDRTSDANSAPHAPSARRK
jgi:very-short-patch-repair endonuclease